MEGINRAATTIIERDDAQSGENRATGEMYSPATAPLSISRPISITKTVPIGVSPSALDNYLAGMMATVVAAPGLAIAATLIVYITMSHVISQGLILICGVLAGLLGWSLLAFVAQYFVTVNRANPKVCQELRSRAEILQTQTHELTRQGNEFSHAEPYALAEARKYLFPLQKVLQLDVEELTEYTEGHLPPRISEERQPIAGTRISND